MRVPSTLIRDSGISVGVTAIASESNKELTFNGVIQSGLNSTLTLPTCGASTVGFHLEPPQNAVLKFEGSWDGLHWGDVTYRQMGADGYSTTTAEHEDWIGSVSTFTHIRFLTTVSGTGTGTITGRFSDKPAIVEGVEHGNMPHRIGSAVIARPFNISKATPNIDLWTPTTGHRICVTDIHFTVTDPSTVVAFTDGSASDGLDIFRGEFKPPNGESVFVPISFSLPHVFSAINRSLMFHQTASAQVIGVVHGYECE